MKVAGIDIGTNSMRMLLTNYRTDPVWTEDRFEERKKETIITRMGKGVNEKKCIDKEIFDSNLRTFESLVSKARSQSAKEIYAVGTSALRDANNGKAFVEEAERQTGVKINIISGNFEAELGFYGVSQGAKSTGRLLIIDIGGGSTEFVVGSQIEGVVYKKSLDIGAVRMTDQFGENFQKMQQFINKKLELIHDIIVRFDVKHVVGIGGTITTLSSVNQSMANYDWKKIHNSTLTHTTVTYLFNTLEKLSVNDRKKVIGLQPGRADIIVAGISILREVMSILKLDEIIVSEYDNLEGLIYYYLRDI